MKTAQKVTVIALLWLMFVNPGSITNLDTERRLNMSHAWWTGTEESFPGNKVVININGKNYIPYDLGQSMLMLPGDWLGDKLGQNLDNEKERQYFREAVVSFLIFLPINLLAVLTCFKFLQLIGYSERIAGLSSIVWLLGTSVLFYSSFHQQNNQILLFVLIGYQAALAYIIKNKKFLAILSGASLGIAFLIRITSILYAVSVLIFLIGCVFSKRNKNLMHHYVHQQGSEDASTFWSGFGVIKRELFLKLDGFDIKRYLRPSIEDIDLGYRLKQTGAKIYLAKELQVKHHKAWKLFGLIKTDVFDRGIPWTILLLSNKSNRINDLNLQTNSRISAIATYSLLLCLLASIFYAAAIVPSLILTMLLLILNWDIYLFFYQKRGFWFALRVIPLHWLYYFYAALSFVIGTLAYWKTNLLSKDTISVEFPASS